MQVPEKLSLIGGSILLASTLIFTLKSQASSIIPHVGHTISGVYQDITNTDAEHGVMSFDNSFKNAQKQGWQTGQWGSSKYYIDDHMNMHIGSGQLQGKLQDVLGNKVHAIVTINLDGNIQAPQDSSWLFYSGDKLQSINDLNNLDTSYTNNMEGMFDHDADLTSLDLSHFETSNVNKMTYMFDCDSNIMRLDLSHLNTSNSDMGAMFDNDNNIKQLSLGSDTKFSIYADIPSGEYWNGNQALNNIQLRDSSSHPGTWIKQ